MKDLESLFAETLALPPEERENFLNRTCGSDTRLSSRVWELVRAHEAAPEFLETTIANVRAIHIHPFSDEIESNCIPGYTLLQKIGEGGCGVVYLADQKIPVQRRVAIKIVKMGMDTKEVIARFEAERQALAVMEHPNIARVLDAGETTTGRPYFVMDLVRGVPITRHCDEHKLGISERVRLFIEVCRAVQHAHQKGIIHRDLKPENILVAFEENIAVPKVIDFGIAKAAQGRLTEHTLVTAIQLFMGTPAYMSPEQTSMTAQDVDTRSDIYSLGVILYEMLTGCTPFDSKTLLEAGVDEMRRVVREDEPLKPSERVERLGAARRHESAASRKMQPEKLSAALRGDLDWIVLRCLEKDRTLRYETANALAMDLGRHLEHEPVVARPRGRIYIFQRLLRRNRLAFSAGGIVLVALGVGLALTVVALNREREARKAAQTEAVRSAQVVRFMKGMLAGVGPQTAMGRDTQMLRAIMDETVERLERDLRDQPEVEADVRTTLGDVYRSLGELSHAVLMYEAALKLRGVLFGPDHPLVADTMMQLADVRGRQGQHALAEEMIQRAVALHGRTLGPNHAVVAEAQAALRNARRRGYPRHGVNQGEPGMEVAPSEVALPAVIRMAHTGGLALGQSYNGGNLLSIVHRQGSLERAFAPLGIQVAWTFFPAGGATNEALRNAQVDFGFQSNIGAFPALAAKLRLKILLRIGVNGSGANYVVVRSDSPIRKLDDLRGRRIGTVKGTACYFTLCHLLEEEGLDRAQLQIVDLGSPSAIKTALAAGEVDADVQGFPFDEVASGAVRIIHEVSPRARDSIVGLFWVAEEFARRYPDVVQRMVNVVVETAAWHSEEGNRAGISANWAALGMSQNQIQLSWAAEPPKQRYSPLLDDFTLGVLSRSVGKAQRWDFINTGVNIHESVDVKYLKRALAELGLQNYWPERRVDEAVGLVK